jgi:spoIIIJ-associated protein
MPAALPQLEETMTDQTVSEEVTTEVVDDAEVAATEALDDAEVAETEAEVEGKPSSADTLENEGEIAADYLEELLDIADLDGDIDTYVEGGRAHVSIVTDGDMLVGSDGSVLEALQELARLAVMTETGRRSRLMLDIAGHRDRRRKELEVLAKDAISDVKESGEPVRLAPMNPFERKIVHDVVAAAGLVSESEGEEPRRCVVVRPA